MKKVAIWLTLLSPLFWAYQCVEREDKCFTEYHLRFEPKIYPERDTFRLNDTIWFEMRIGDSIFDIYSQKWIPSNRVTFPFYLTMTKLEPTRYLPAEEMFDFIALDGVIKFERLSQFTNLRIEMLRRFDGNIAKFAFIPRQIGIFKVTPNIARVDLENLQVGSDGCRPFVKDISIKTNSHSNTNNGYFWIRVSGSPDYQNYSEENHKKDGSFAFFVID